MSARKRKRKLPLTGYENYDRHIRNFNRSEFHATPLGVLRFLESERSRTSPQTRARMSPAHCKQAKFALKKSARRLTPEGTRKLLEGISQFQVRVEKTRIRPEDCLSTDEVRRFVERIRPRKMAPLVLALLYSGGRIRSILSTEIKNCHINVERKIVVFYSYDGKVNKVLDYEIPLWLYGAIRSRFEPCAYLFGLENGKALPYNYVQKKLKSEGWRILKKRVHAHLFRHSIATHLIQNDVVSIVQVANLLHHERPSTTSDIYVHLKADHDTIIGHLETLNFNAALKVRRNTKDATIKHQARGISQDSATNAESGASRRTGRTVEGSQGSSTTKSQTETASA